MKVSELCNFLKLKFEGDDFEIVGFCSLTNQKDYCLTFNSDNRVPKIYKKKIAILSLVKPDSECVWIESENPRLDFIKAFEIVTPKAEISWGIHDSAVIHPTAKIHSELVQIGPFVTIEEGAEIFEGCRIYPGAYVGKKVKIGKRTIIYPGVIIMDWCEIGENCVVGPGSVIGSEGFGFIPLRDGVVKFPQIGKVIIEDHVEIGANVTIDRGALDDTIIRRNTKIDNLVQIGHNVEIGQNTIICGQVGIAGSSKIGSNCILGGQVGIRDHVIITDFVRIAGKSGVQNNILEKGDYMNIFPIMQAYKWKKFVAFLKSMFKRLKD